MNKLNKLFLALLLTTASASVVASSAIPPTKMTRINSYSECVRFVEGVTHLVSKVQYLDKNSKSYSDDINNVIVIVSDKYQIDQSSLVSSVMDMSMYPQVSSDQLNSYLIKQCNVGVGDGTLIDDRYTKPID